MTDIKVSAADFDHVVSRLAGNRRLTQVDPLL
jgi:hypothetical protein